MKYGKCHLCGREGNLTFEHTPPRKAFNSDKAFILQGKRILEFDDRLFPWQLPHSKGELKQGGIGGYTLCGKCNNNTGKWYGGAFVDFIRKGYREVHSQECISNTFIKITLNDIYPLRVVKQIMTMFFSINNPNLSDVHPELRELVLSKEKRGISGKDFGLYMYIIESKSMLRRLGLTVIGENVMSKDFKTRVVSELSAYPFGFILEFRPKDKKSFYDIAYFANDFDYDQKATINLSIPIYEINTWHPLDYRKRKKIMIDYIKDKLYSRMNKKIRKSMKNK